MLTVADLFSGIGGFSVALDVFEGMQTVTYCDIDARSQSVLRKLVKEGKLPSAPVHDDVKTLHFDTPVDMIVGGFPCTGFSATGFRQGIQNKGSGLIHEVFRLVQEARPKFVFMENVTNITGFPEYVDICSTFGDLGYRVSWTSVKASDLGAAQRRHRWFALCSRLDVAPKSVSLRLKPEHHALPLFDWSQEPQRMSLEMPPKMAHRLFLLGNTVVPQAARVAFVSLFTGLKTDIETLLKQNEFVFDIPTSSSPVQSARSVHSGMWDNGFFEVDPPKMMTSLVRPRNLVLDPASWVSTRPRVCHSKIKLTPLKEAPVEIPFWGTPRCNMGCSNYLSRRTCTDLRTQIRFERQTEHREGYITVKFVEWLQGYPEDWTMFPPGEPVMPRRTRESQQPPPQ